jgi:prolycopene isomerase
MTRRATKNSYDAIIVGSGLGGLATASLLSLKGKRVLVLERYEVLKSCGVADKVRFLAHPRVYRFVKPGVDIAVDERNVDKYIELLGDLYPLEKENLKRLFAELGHTYDQIGRLFTTSVPVPLRILSLPLVYRKIFKYENDTLDQFLSRFVKDQGLKDLLCVQWTYYGVPPDKLSFLYSGYPMFDYLQHGGYAIEGGSQVLSDRLVDVIRANGGEVKLATQVRKLLVEQGRVVGVEGKNIGEVFSDRVISNVSPYMVTKMAGEQHFKPKFMAALNKQTMSISGFQVYLGLDCSVQQLGIGKQESVIFVGNEHPLRAQYESMKDNDLQSGRTAFSINFYSNVDPTLAPAGKATLGLSSLCGGKYWCDLSREEYDQRKQEVTESMIQRAERVMPGLKSRIEVCETGTPRTMTKYTSNPAGCFYGFEQSLDQAGFWNRFEQRYPIKGLYQVGAWTFPGAGYIGALMSARFLVDRYF